MVSRCALASSVRPTEFRRRARWIDLYTVLRSFPGNALFENNQRQLQWRADQTSGEDPRPLLRILPDCKVKRNSITCRPGKPSNGGSHEKDYYSDWSNPHGSPRLGPKLTFIQFRAKPSNAEVPVTSGRLILHRLHSLLH